MVKKKQGSDPIQRLENLGSVKAFPLGQVLSCGRAGLDTNAFRSHLSRQYGAFRFTDHGICRVMDRTSPWFET